VSVNLAPNLGSSPAGLYYTAIYHLSDGTTSTEYWVIPAAAQASIAQVRSQVMPAAQAVQAVSKAYVDQAIQSVAQGNLTSTGGQLTGPLYLTGDPTQTLQAADKHYVDSSLAQAVPMSGGAVNGPLTAQQLGAAYQVDQFAGADFGAKLQACLAKINSTFGGTCDARNFAGDGVECDYFNCEYNGDATLRNDRDGKSDCDYSRHAQCVVARLRFARRKYREWQPGWYGAAVFRFDRGNSSR
jgi:hypothetical protein